MLGSFGSVCETTPLELEAPALAFEFAAADVDLVLLLLFLATETPTPTPIAMRATTPTTEPMTLAKRYGRCTRMNRLCVQSTLSDGSGLCCVQGRCRSCHRRPGIVDRRPWWATTRNRVESGLEHQVFKLEYSPAPRLNSKAGSKEGCKQAYFGRSTYLCLPSRITHDT